MQRASNFHFCTPGYSKHIDNAVLHIIRNFSQIRRAKNSTKFTEQLDNQPQKHRSSSVSKKRRNKKTKWRTLKWSFEMHSKRNYQLVTRHIMLSRMYGDIMTPTGRQIPIAAQIASPQWHYLRHKQIKQTVEFVASHHQPRQMRRHAKGLTTQKPFVDMPEKYAITDIRQCIHTYVLVSICTPRLHSIPVTNPFTKFEKVYSPHQQCTNYS